MIEYLAPLFLKGGESAVGWAVGKALDVLWKSSCNDPVTQRISNVTYNDLYCRNCGEHRHQFTNACERTVGRDGRISQIGIKFGSFEHIRDRPGVLGEVLGWKCTDVQAPISYHCHGFAGQDLIEVNDIYNLKTGEKVYSDISTFRPASDLYVANRWLRLPRNDMSDELFVSLFRNDALLAFDTRVENRFRDVLVKDRTLHQM